MASPRHCAQANDNSEAPWLEQSDCEWLFKPARARRGRTLKCMPGGKGTSRPAQATPRPRRLAPTASSHSHTSPARQTRSARSAPTCILRSVAVINVIGCSGTLPAHFVAQVLFSRADLRLGAGRRGRLAQTRPKGLTQTCVERQGSRAVRLGLGGKRGGGGRAGRGMQSVQVHR